MIETDRLLIRPWRANETDRFLDIYTHPEIVRWFLAAPALDRAEAGRRIERNLARLASDPWFGRWAIVERSAGVPDQRRHLPGHDRRRSHPRPPVRGRHRGTVDDHQRNRLAAQTTQNSGQ